MNRLDPTGLDIVFLNQRVKGLADTELEFGHNAILIENSEGGWMYYSKNGVGLKNVALPYDSLADFYNDEKISKLFDFDRSYLVETTSTADERMIEYATENYNKPYSVRELAWEDIYGSAENYGFIIDPNEGNISENCADLIFGIITAGGELEIDKPKNEHWLVGGEYTDPSTQYDNFVAANEGTVIETSKEQD